MRTLKDPVSLYDFFQDFEKQISPNLFSGFEKIYIENEKQIKKVKNIRISMYCILFPTFLFLILIIISYLLSWPLIVKVPSILLFFIYVSYFIVCLFVNRKIINNIKAKYQEYANSIDTDQIYKDSFALLGSDIIYWYKPANDSNSDLQVINFPKLTNRDFLEYRSNAIPDFASVSKVQKPKYFVLNNMYPATIQNVLFRWEERIDRTVRVFYEWNAFIKVDTSKLSQENRFDFALFDLSNGVFSSRNHIQLENEKFNKYFNVKSLKELKTRKIYTPLAQELSVKWYEYGKENVKHPDCFIVSKDDQIIYSISSSETFTNYSYPSSIYIDEFIKATKANIINDIYNIYFLLYYLELSLYL